MLGTKILPAILVAVPATLWLAAQPSFGEPAGDTCRMSPGAAAPQGLHWYYRVDRATKRHCWYLSTGGIHVHSFANVAAPAPSQHENTGEQAGATANGTVQTAAAQTATAQTPSAEAALLEPPVRGHSAIDFTSRWLELPKSLDLGSHDVTPPSKDYGGERGETIAVAQMSSPPFVTKDQGGGRDQSKGSRRRSGAGPSFGSILLACALGIVFLLLCREAFKLLGMLRLEVRRRHASAVFPASGRFRSVAEAWLRDLVRPRPQQGNWSSDTEISMSDFMGVLRRADAASYSPRSFAPSSHQITKIPAIRRILRSKNLRRRPQSAVNSPSRNYATV